MAETFYIATRELSCDEYHGHRERCFYYYIKAVRGPLRRINIDGDLHLAVFTTLDQARKAYPDFHVPEATSAADAAEAKP